jgi:cellulase/cellobiase CelA1
LPENPASSGVYQTTIGPVQPSHGDTVIDINISCPDGSSINQSVPVFIDPSGFIMDTNGWPVEDATVTLYHEVWGSWQVAPAVPWIMDPAINPQVTLADGRFGWDVVAGTYKVRAEKDGCHAPGDPSQLYVETGALPVPPEYTNIYLYLECDGSSGGDDLDVQVLPMSDWETGYCRTVVVTNNTDEAVDWQVTFELVDGGVIDYFWNVIWSQSGNQVTAEGVSWNNILQPGESTHSLGFCAFR